MRTYQGFFADSTRWHRFPFRPDDVVISTPSKCGTSWLQAIVGMLVLGRVDLGAPIGALSPWLDVRTRSEAEVVALLEAQDHRRWIKTHTPLDGIPRRPGVTYLAGMRHPLDVALSDRDHRVNHRDERARELVDAAGERDLGRLRRDLPPEDVTDYLRWFVDNDVAPDGSGPHGLDDLCQQARAAWEVRHEPGVVLVHYADLWADLDGEARRIADALGVAVDEASWPALVRAATFEDMRSRADRTAPDAHLGIWHDTTAFFRSGGTRDWASLLDEADVAHFHERLHDLAGDAAGWVLAGRAALR